MLALFLLLALGCSVSTALPSPGTIFLPAAVRASQTPAPSATLAPSSTPMLDSPIPPAEAAAGDTWLSPVDGAVLAYVPEGEFLMGSVEGSADASDNEYPQHRVFLSAFWIDRTEVTNARYALCVRAGACSPPGSLGSSTRENYYADAQYADYPVIHVTWNDAAAYCAWAGRRLPTEAEWEKAAGGGRQGALYPWGDQAPDCDRFNFRSDDGVCIDDTAQAGSYAANGYGLFDMSGNVWEWLQDWYAGGYYAGLPDSNPPGPETGGVRVLRGGCWNNRWPHVRLAYRGYFDPTSRYEGIGFRCLLSPGK